MGGAVAEAALAGVAALEAGGLLAHPTSTVYGIGGPSTKRADVAIGALKRRPADQPLLRLVPDAVAVPRLFPGARWPRECERLAAVFWPGPLTLIIDDGSLHGLAVRAESHPLLRAILSRWDGSLSSTSLNPSGSPPAVSPREARQTLEGFPNTDLPITFLAAGPLQGPPASTLVSLRSGDVRVVREGAIGAAEIEACLGESLRA